MSEQVKSVAQALRILTILQRNENVGVKEVAHALGVAQSTAHRLLNTLKDFQYVTQGDDKRYHRGPALTGHDSAAALQRCIDIARPYMRKLRDDSGETIHLSSLEYTSSIFHVAEESKQLLRLSSRVGTKLPAHLTASGKISLARLPTEELLRRYPESGDGAGILAAEEREQLFNTLKLVRSVGYGRNACETEDDVCALALPIRSRDGHVLCCITISGPASRFNPAPAFDEVSPVERKMLKMLRDATLAIERKL